MATWFSDSITKVTDKNDQSTEAQKAHFRRVANEIFTAKQKEGLTHSSEKGKMNLQKNWFEKIMQHGSTRDRVSLQYKLLSENPIPRAKYLDSLILMVNPAKKRDCLMAMDILRRLFLMLLPKSRTLIPFDQRPLHVLESLTATKSVDTKKEKKTKPSSRLDAVLLLWIFEDQLRKQYATFITNLENVALRDNLEQNKKRAIGVLFDLIVHKPELRKRIVKILVNKVGDPSRKLASHAKHKLLLAVNEKHVFVPEFVDEFEAMLYRSNISEKAQYFVMCCLNSMFLRKKKGSTSSPSDVVPLKLVKIYCSFFDASLDKGKVVKRKMLNAILSGISRAFPFLSREEVNTHLQPHVNSLFRLVHTACNFNQAVQTLMVLFHFMKHQDDLKDRFYQALYRKLADYRLIRRSGQRQALLLHLLFRALQEDDNSARLQAFAKRLLTLCLYSSDTALVCGLLLMLSELTKIHPDIITTKQMTSLKKFGGDDAMTASDSEEFFSDIDSDLEEEDRAVMRRQKKKAKVEATAPVVKHYDPTVRDPRHSGAELDCTWELLRLQNFFHPSVRVFAEAILTGTPINYSGDPFTDFTLIHFLERFLQKKPKRDPAKSSEQAPNAKDLATNSAEYRSLPEESIPEDEKCFYEFSKAREARQAKRRKKIEKSGEDDDDEEDHDSVPDEEFDAYLDKFEDKLDDIPLDGLSDSGSDLGLSSGDEEDEEMSFTMSDLSSEAGDEEGKEDEDDEDDDDDEEFDEDAMVGEDDEDEDEFMEVDDDDEESDEREMFESDDESDMDFDGHKETPKQRKQRLWEEKRTSDFDFGGKKGMHSDRSRSSFRGKDRGRGSSRGRGGGHRGKGKFGDKGGSFGGRGVHKGSGGKGVHKGGGGRGGVHKGSGGREGVHKGGRGRGGVHKGGGGRGLGEKNAFRGRGRGRGHRSH